jgi:hypothetical protein
VGVFPVFVGEAAKRAAGTNVTVVAKCGHQGLSKSTVKAIECTSAIKDGAREVQVEPLLAAQIAGDFDATKQELLEIVRACRATGRDAKIFAIVRSMLLQRDGGEKSIEGVCRAVREGACDGILDIGDDASHALVRTHAQNLLISRSMPSADWHGVKRSVHPHIYRIEVFCELFGIDSARDIMM